MANPTRRAAQAAYLRNWIFTIALAIVLGGIAPAQISGASHPESGGEFFADQFGIWSITAISPVMAPGTVTVQLSSSVAVLSDGSTFMPFATNAPLLIRDGVKSETVQPTAVHCSFESSTCTFTATFTSSHPGQFSVSSGTFGLQEAINTAAAGGGGAVVITDAWRGSANMIANAALPPHVAVLDRRQGSITWYGSNTNSPAAIFSLQADAGTVQTFQLLQSKVLDSVRFCDQFPGNDAGDKIANCISDLPATGGVADAEGLQGAQMISRPLVINKPILLLLSPGASFAQSASVVVESSGVYIAGNGASFVLAADSSFSSPLWNGGSFGTQGRYAWQINGSNIVLDGLQLNGNRSNNVGAAYNGIAISGSTNVVVRNSQLVHWERWGVYITSATAENTTSGTPVSSLIHVKDNLFSDDGRPDGFSDGGAVGIQNGGTVGAPQGYWVSGNQASDCYNFADIMPQGNPLQDIHIDRNIVTGGIGTNLWGQIVSESQANQRIWITNNTLLAATSEAIYIVGGDGIVVAGNRISGSAQNGMAISSYYTTVRNVEIRDNEIRNSKQVAGIGIATQSGNAISGITIRGNRAFDDQSAKTQTYGLSIATVSGTISGLSVFGNDFEGNASGSINMPANLTLTDAFVADDDNGSWDVLAGTIKSSVATGAAPFQVASVTPVPNLSLGGGTGTSVATNSLSVGGDNAMTANPRALASFFIPGNLTSSWLAAQWTPDRAIAVTRIEAAARQAPVGCTQNATLTIAQGSSSYVLPVNGGISSSTVDLNFSAQSPVSIQVSAATGCTTNPADVNVAVQYRMQ